MTLARRWPAHKRSPWPIEKPNFLKDNHGHVSREDWESLETLIAPLRVHRFLTETLQGDIREPGRVVVARVRSVARMRVKKSGLGSSFHNGSIGSRPSAMITVYALVWCHTLGPPSHPAQACLSYGGQPTFSSIEECLAYAAPLKQRIAPRTPKGATLTVECIARSVSGPKATGETAGAEPLSRPKADPLAARPGGSSNRAAIAKVESTSPFASAPNPPLPAPAHPKHEKSTKARNATQAAAEPPPPPPVAPPPPPPAEPAAQPGNPLLRAVGDAFKSGGS
jgi:hypothetical protein